MAVDAESPEKLDGGVARSAGLIAILTVASRITGFGRYFVFAAAVGITPLGGIYLTINTLPNIIYEVVAGGALAAVVVPLISAALARGNKQDVNHLASSLMTWSVCVLTPLALLVAVFAYPIASFMLGPEATSKQVDIGARMLIVFAPQLTLYGVGIVLTGIIQAFHRFAWPALAPMLSSLTVMAAYFAFAFTTRDVRTDNDTSFDEALESITPLDEAILAGGTTLAVAVLTLSLFIPLRATGVRLRPSWSFPSGTRRTVQGLLASGVVTIGAQQIALLVVLILLQPPAPGGAVVVYTLAQTIYFLPWAVLAVPIAISAFPRLSAAWTEGNRERFLTTVKSTARMVVVLCVGASAVLVAIAEPIAVMINDISEGPDSTRDIQFALIAIAPGLTGYGLLALLSRALYAMGVSLATAIVTASSWAVVIAADFLLVALTPDEWRVVAVALGNTIGMVGVGVGLTYLVRAKLDQTPLHLGGITLSSVGVGILSGMVGYGVVSLLPETSFWWAAVSGTVAAGIIVVSYGALMRLVAPETISQILSLRRG